MLLVISQLEHHSVQYNLKLQNGRLNQIMTNTSAFKCNETAINFNRRFTKNVQLSTHFTYLEYGNPNTHLYVHIISYLKQNLPIYLLFSYSTTCTADLPTQWQANNVISCLHEIRRQ